MEQLPTAFRHLATLLEINYAVVIRQWRIQVWGFGFQVLNQQPETRNYSYLSIIKN